MLGERLQDFKIILASGSPRRQEYCRQLGLDFEIRIKEVEENYPSNLKGQEITEYLAKLKADVFLKELKPNEIVITSDTVVWHENKALGKPASREEAFTMIKSMSNKYHEVITSVCFTSGKKQSIETCVTKVKFIKLDEGEIDYYINHFKPFDKAGAYGIQEWIGHIGIEEIQGSYTNVVGLPTHLVYKKLMGMVG
ncbi:MAG: Maf-like protein [Aurantibacter sp.]